MSTSAATQHVWWLASRASGVVALALVSLSVGLGLAMAGRISRRPGTKRTMVAVHEQAALAGLVAIAVHGLTLLGDAWLHPGLRGVFVPFAMSYRTVWTGIGIVGAYLAAALGLSFYLRRHIGARLWRKAHRLTIVVYVLSLGHALGAGTDAGSAWLRWSILATAVPIGLLFLIRIMPGAKAGRPQPRGTRAGRPQPEGTRPLPQPARPRPARPRPARPRPVPSAAPVREPA